MIFLLFTSFFRKRSLSIMKKRKNFSRISCAKNLGIYDKKKSNWRCVEFIHLFMSSRTYVQQDNLPKKGRIYVQQDNFFRALTSSRTILNVLDINKCTKIGQKGFYNSRTYFFTIKMFGFFVFLFLFGGSECLFANIAVINFQ